MHASREAGRAFFFHDTLDFSSYAVGASGKYLIAMYDSSGRVAWGYGKAAGVTETVAATLGTNTNFSSDEPAGTAWTRGAGWTISGGVAVAAGGISTNLTQVISHPIGGLYKSSYDIKSRTAGSVKGAYDGTSGSEQSVVADGYVEYRTVTSAERSFGIAAVGFTGTIDNRTFQKVLTPPATGLTITSTPDGTTYNWAQITTGFDANAVTSVKIWRVQ